MSERGHLVDTNVLSELGRPSPDPDVVRFVAGLRGGPVFVSVLTLGELRRGAELKRRRDVVHAGRIDRWIALVEREYVERVLIVDRDTAELWGHLSADRPRPIVDTLIAATAIVHGLTLVTRNVRDFAGLDLAVANPWVEQR